jgi:hypothetical protein
MVFLVDGSWSVGHSHFQQVKDFLASVIEPFEIGPDKVQVGEYCSLWLILGVGPYNSSPAERQWPPWEEGEECCDPHRSSASQERRTDPAD